MTGYLNDKYINLLTDFGFKRVFGTELNKGLLIDFLNTLLPPERQIEDVTFRNNENIGNTPIDRKAIFDIYCQGTNGERFIVNLADLTGRPQSLQEDVFNNLFEIAEIANFSPEEQDVYQNSLKYYSVSQSSETQNQNLIPCIVRLSEIEVGSALRRGG